MKSGKDLKYALFIKDFPGFDYENLTARKSTLWEHTNFDGYCCGHEPEFFKEIYSGPLKFITCPIIEINNDQITIFPYGIKVELKLSETEYGILIKKAMQSDKLVHVDLVCANGKYKIMEYRIETS